MNWFFHNKTSNLRDMFLVFAREFSDPPETAEKIYTLLPDPIKKAVVVQDKLTNLWRYKFGEIYDRLGNKQVAIGSPQFNCVKYLYQGVKLAEKNLDGKQLEEFLGRLSNSHKHLEVLFEMRPVLSIDSSTSVSFEVLGHGAEGKTIDWLILCKNNTKVLVEVKLRHKGLVSHLKEVSKQSEEDPKYPAPDPSDLFRSTSEKFETCKDQSILQGVWANTQVKEDKIKLFDFFRGLDDTKIHFLILSDWKEDATVLTRNDSQKEQLRKIFKYVESDRFVGDYEND